MILRPGHDEGREEGSREVLLIGAHAPPAPGDELIEDGRAAQCPQEIGGALLGERQDAERGEPAAGCPRHDEPSLDASAPRGRELGVRAAQRLHAELGARRGGVEHRRDVDEARDQLPRCLGGAQLRGEARELRLAACVVGDRQNELVSAREVEIDRLPRNSRGGGDLLQGHRSAIRLQEPSGGAQDGLASAESLA